ncbi:MAG: RNA-binding protein [Microgenomates group bacterium]
MPSPNIAPTTRLFVGGLPYRITEGELLALFATYGRIVSLKIMHTKWGKSRGMGFVEFDNLDSAITAKQQLHNYKIAEDRTIIVDYAAPDPVLHPELRINKDEPVKKEFTTRDPYTKQNRGTNKSKSSKVARSPFLSARRSFSEGGSKGEAAKPRVILRGKPKFGSTRQSVFDSQSHHSRVGAKFAKRKSR